MGNHANTEIHMLRYSIFEGLSHDIFGSLIREGGGMFPDLTYGERLLVVRKHERVIRPCVLTFVPGQLVDFGLWANTYHNATANERIPTVCALVKLPSNFDPDRTEFHERIKFAIDAYVATLPEPFD